MNIPYRKVEKSELERFIAEYPRPLTTGTTTICEPPIRHYLDDRMPTSHRTGTIEHFLDKEVAKITMGWLGPNGEVDRDNTQCFWEYWIRVLDPVKN